MKNNKLYIIISVVCFVLAAGICIFLIINNKTTELTDGQKFKKQFEDLNKIESIYTKEKFVQLHIDEDNPMIYKTAKETLEILKNETAIIFMGYPESDLTRTILPIFLDVLKEESVEKVYYLDIFDIRDEFEYDGSIIPKEVKKGTNAYYGIVEFLSDYLEKYYVSDADGNQYGTSVKRVETPTIVTVKNGKVIDFHYGAVIYHNEENFELNDLEQNKLKEIYQEIISNYKKTSELCSSSDAC